MNRTEKEQLVASFKERFSKISNAFVAEYRGLKSNEINELRYEVRQMQGQMRVTKNRLMKRGMAEASVSGLEDKFKGPTAIFWGGQDPVVLAKFLSKFQEDHPVFKLKGGYLDGRVLEVKEVESLAKLPSKEELYGKLVRTLMAPASNLARVLNALPQKVVRVLDAIAKKEQS
ncbi:MAG: 50S ribosomal protein L10 [bacterium]|nr:50S ribosomal protein L10 [bacterium]